MPSKIPVHMPGEGDIAREIQSIAALTPVEVARRWQEIFGKEVPATLPRDLMVRQLAWRLQEEAFGGHDRGTLRLLDSLAGRDGERIALYRRVKPGTVVVGILEASGGRLSPFKPIADDDGMDLLLFDKINRRAIPLQIKSRRTFDDPKALTVQFDVRLKTFTRKGEGYLLCLKMEGASVDTLWLIPASDLPAISKQTPTHLTVVPSTKATSQDRLTPYRVTSFSEAVVRILGRESA